MVQGQLILAGASCAFSSDHKPCSRRMPQRLLQPAANWLRSGREKKTMDAISGSPGGVTADPADDWPVSHASQAVDGVAVGACAVGENAIGAAAARVAAEAAVHARAVVAGNFGLEGDDDADYAQNAAAGDYYENH
jgi:hypothetical protein